MLYLGAHAPYFSLPLLFLFSPSFFPEVALIYVLHVLKPSLNLPVARVYKHTSVQPGHRQVQETLPYFSLPLLLLFSPSSFPEVTLIYVLRVLKPSLNLPVAGVYKHTSVHPGHRQVQETLGRITTNVSLIYQPYQGKA